MRLWCLRPGSPESEQEHSDEQRLGKPEGVGGEAGGDDGPEDGSEKKAEGDEAEIERFASRLDAGADVRFQVLAECSFGKVAQIAGDEGGVVVEAAYPAEGRDLEGGDKGDGQGEGNVRGAGRNQADAKERRNFEAQCDKAAAVQRHGVEEASGGNAEQVGGDRRKMRENLFPVAG